MDTHTARAPNSVSMKRLPRYANCARGLLLSQLSCTSWPRELSISDEHQWYARHACAKYHICSNLIFCCNRWVALIARARWIMKLIFDVATSHRSHSSSDRRLFTLTTSYISNYYWSDRKQRNVLRQKTGVREQAQHHVLSAITSVKLGKKHKRYYIVLAEDGYARGPSVVSMSMRICAACVV